MKRAGVVFLVCAACLTLSSCASLMTGRSQKIPVITQPSGATATCGQQTIITPGEFSLLRVGAPYTVSIKKDGYWEETVFLKRTVSGAVAGNLLLGGIIGIGVDAATGAMYKLTPEEINILLKPTSGPKLEEAVIEEAVIEEAVIEKEVIEEVAEGEKIETEEQQKTETE